MAGSELPVSEILAFWFGSTALMTIAPPAVGARWFRPDPAFDEEVSARFGRYPGRNPALGRSDTAEEGEWLQSGGDTFGQR